MAKTNVYEMVTERIIAELEKGVIPWEKPWTGVRSGAYNRVSKRPWDDTSEADREDLAKILFEKMDAEDLKEIMDEVSENQKDLDEDDGFYNVYNVYDEDDDLDDEEAF